MSPQSTMTPAIITAMPGAGRGSPSRIAASIARHRRRARAAVTTPARISRTPTVSHAQGSVCPARSRAAATPEATSASAVRSHARYVRSFASWNCASGPRRSLMPAPPFSRCREPSAPLDGLRHPDRPGPLDVLARPAAPRARAARRASCLTARRLKFRPVRGLSPSRMPSRQWRCPRARTEIRRPRTASPTAGGARRDAPGG
jgi:hypothetical protein